MGGAGRRGASACLLQFTVSCVPVSRQAWSSGELHTSTPPYIRLTGRAAERPDGGSQTGLTLPVKQKLNVISLPQLPSDVTVFY